MKLSPEEPLFLILVYLIFNVIFMMFSVSLYVFPVFQWPSLLNVFLQTLQNSQKTLKC